MSASLVSSRTARAPQAAARASSSVSSRRPMPRPRTASATHMRLMVAGSFSWNLRAPQPIGLDCSEAKRKRPAGARSSCSARGMLREGSKPASKRRFSSAKYSRRHCRACGWAGSITITSTIAAVIRRSMSAIAATRRPRCLGLRGARSDSASSSLRSSSTARSAKPDGVSRAVRIRPSDAFDPTVTIPAASSERSSRLRYPESRPS